MYNVDRLAKHVLDVFATANPEFKAYELRHIKDVGPYSVRSLTLQTGSGLLFPILVITAPNANGRNKGLIHLTFEDLRRDFVDHVAVLVSYGQACGGEDVIPDYKNPLTTGYNRLFTRGEFMGLYTDHEDGSHFHTGRMPILSQRNAELVLKGQRGIDTFDPKS